MCANASGTQGSGPAGTWWAFPGIGYYPYAFGNPPNSTGYVSPIIGDSYSFGAGGGPGNWDAPPQSSPVKVGTADKARPQSAHTSLVLSALMDGSVRTISSAISYPTWAHALTPMDGNVLGSDW